MTPGPKHDLLDDVLRPPRVAHQPGDVSEQRVSMLIPECSDEGLAGVRAHGGPLAPWGGGLHTPTTLQSGPKFTAG
jgi:hypothetical protein